jgi:hypothetical protein
MPSPFQEFSETYNAFRKAKPDHPLVAEIRSNLGKMRFPSDVWLKARTKRMRELMAPLWVRVESKRDH